MSAHFVSELPRKGDPPPSCHVCGAAMVRCCHQHLGKDGKPKAKKFWKCESCGAATEPS